MVIGDPPDAWRAAGFTVDDDAVCRVGTVRLRLNGREDGKGIRSWALDGVQLDGPDLDGLPTTPSTAGPGAPAMHANGTREIDHVVVATPVMARTVGRLEGA